MINKMRAFFAEQWANSIDGKNTLEVSLKQDIQQRINLADVNAILLNDVANIDNKIHIRDDQKSHVRSETREELDSIIKKMESTRDRMLEDVNKGKREEQ